MTSLSSFCYWYPYSSSPHLFSSFPLPLLLLLLLLPSLILVLLTCVLVLLFLLPPPPLLVLVLVLLFSLVIVVVLLLPLFSLLLLLLLRNLLLLLLLLLCHPHHHNQMSHSQSNISSFPVSFCHGRYDRTDFLLILPTKDNIREQAYSIITSETSLLVFERHIGEEGRNLLWGFHPIKKNSSTINQ